MPRLLIDGTALTPRPKGVGRYSYHVVDQLCRRLPREWVIEVVTSYTELPPFSGANIPRLIGVRRSSDVVTGTLTLSRAIFSRRPDVVVVPRDYSAFTLGCRTICVAHDVPELIEAAGGTDRKPLRKMIDAVKDRIRVALLRRSEVVVCNSIFTAGEVTARYGLRPERVRIGYCGVDARFYERDGAHAAQFWSALQHWSGYVLTFATGDPRESYDLCPEIWSRVRARVPGVGLVVAGVREGSNYVDRLRAAFAARGLAETRDIVFVPFLGEDAFTKLRALYRDADFYLELSGHEGFGMQLAEAMATGTTCITSTRGALGEVAGGHAVLFDSLDPSAISATVAAAYEHALHRRDSTAQIAYTRRFNWDAVGELLAAEVARMGPRVSA